MAAKVNSSLLSTTLQHQINSMQPRIGGLAVEPDFPLRLVEIAEAFARRHLEAVVEQPHDLVGRIAGAVEPDLADDGLRYVGDEQSTSSPISVSSSVTSTCRLWRT